MLRPGSGFLGGRVQTETIRIDGMSCQHCVARVREALAAVEGVHVESVTVGEAVVSSIADATSRESVLAAIRSVGYTAESSESRV